jgi:hypothetical protein
MPIGFETTNAGQIAVGFFNIETDCLLMGRYFFFASDFCGWVKSWAEQDPPESLVKEFYVADRFQDIGNIHAAMAHFYQQDLLSDVFQRFPFPEDPLAFRQHPDGWKNRKALEAILPSHTHREQVTISFHKPQEAVLFGEYEFHKSVFSRVLQYLFRGGMPMWRDGVPPVYVLEMMRAVGASQFWLLR